MEAEMYLQVIEAGNTVPTVEGLAYRLKIHKDTLYSHDEFSDVLERIKNLQAARLIEKGLSGQYNATIAKLLLSSKHGYVEKSEQDITSKGERIAAADKTVVDQFTEHLSESTKA